MKLDILAIGVHPDDVELSCSGTLLSHIDKGYSVGLLDLTMGELGTRGNAQVRTQEAMQAAKNMGAKVREQLDIPDGFFSQNKENLLKIISIIRKYCPTVVFANAPDDRHPDHGRASKMVSDACFLSGLIKIETFDDKGLPQATWRPNAVYHYIQDRVLKPDFVVDITGFVEQKFELIMTFKSQFFDPLSIEPKTPISGEDFLNSIRAKDAIFGRTIGTQAAEGFTVDRTVGVKDVFDLL